MGKRTFGDLQIDSLIYIVKYNHLVTSKVTEIQRKWFKVDSGYEYQRGDGKDPELNYEVRDTCLIGLRSSSATYNAYLNKADALSEVLTNLKTERGKLYKKLAEVRENLDVLEETVQRTMEDLAKEISGNPYFGVDFGNGLDSGTIVADIPNDKVEEFKHLVMNFSNGKVTYFQNGEIKQ